MVPRITAEIQGKAFGQGASEMAGVENMMVVFMLGLITGVVAMTVFFVFLSWWERRKRQLPDETEQLLQEMEEDFEEPKPSNPFRRSSQAQPEEEPSDPWERDPDWWRKED